MVDPVVLDLLKGPEGVDHRSQISWLKRCLFAVTAAREPNIKLMAEPLQALIELASRMPDLPEAERKQAEIHAAAIQMHLHGLALYAYLVELKTTRDFIGQKALTLKPGSPDRVRTEALRDAYHQGIAALAQLYEHLRAGRFDQFQSVKPELDRIEALSKKLANEFFESAGPDTAPEE